MTTTIAGQPIEKVAEHLEWSEETFDKNIAEVRENIEDALDVCDEPEVRSLVSDYCTLMQLKAAKYGAA
jgi:hypothetical protein